MNTVTVSFNTTGRQMTEMSQESKTSQQKTIETSQRKKKQGELYVSVRSHSTSYCKRFFLQFKAFLQTIHGDEKIFQHDRNIV